MAKNNAAPESEVGGLISPIQFAAIVAPEKPPQYAYQLLKQGLPHQIIFTKDKHGQDKQKPMIDLEVARQWYEDSLLTKAPRKTREGTVNGPIQGESIRKPAAYQKGQLLAYQRRPGLVTVAQIMAGDATLVYYTTVHGDEVHTDMDTKYTYPFTPDHLREKILGRKILLDHPRRVLQYVIDSLTSLPCQEDDTLLAQALIEALRNHPQQIRIPTQLSSEDDSDVEVELEDIPDSAPVEEEGVEEEEGFEVPVDEEEGD